MTIFSHLTAMLLQVAVDSGSLLILGILSVVAGLSILVVPRVLNYIVAVYLIVIGVVWIVAAL